MLNREFSFKIGDLQRQIAELQQIASGAEMQREVLAEALQGLSASLEALLCAEQELRQQDEEEKLTSTLERERDMLQAIMENTHAQLAYLDPQFNFVRVNSAYASGSGHCKEELIGRNHFELFPNPENQAIFERVRETGQAAEFHARPFEYADQPERGITYWDWTLVPVKDGAGHVQGLLLSLLEVTERKQAEEALQSALEESQQRQAEISALLAGSRAVLDYREFEAAARSIFDTCKRLIGATAGYVALLSEDGTENDVLFLDSGGAACTVEPTLPMPVRGLCEEAYRTGKIVYENDFSRGEWKKLLPPRHVRLDNVLFAPLVVKGIAVGLLGLANKSGGFTEDDARMASAFGELAAIALFNSRALESLQNSEERFRAVAQSAGEAIVTIDSRGNIVFWNKAATTMFGYTPDEAIGKPLTFIMPERFHAAHQNGMERVVSTGKSRLIGKTVEMVGLGRDGREFPVELSLSSWKIGAEVFFTGIIHDITERVRAEETLRERTHELGEQVKKLNCLYGISALMEKPGISLAEILQGTVDLIPLAWQYPEITGARVSLGSQEFKTENFRETTPWQQAAGIQVHGRRSGTVEVCYLQERPESDQGPFFKEERSLLNAIAERLGRITERVWAEEALQKAHNELELRVQERTAALEKANQALQAEIAERRQAEAELRSSEERFRQLAENIREAFWITDSYKGQIIYVSPAYGRMWGRPCESLYRRPESFLDTIHPEDREQVIVSLEKQFREETDESYRIVHPDGSVRWIRARTFPIRNEQGEVYRIAGIAEDITERVQAYQMLEQRVEERTRELSTLLGISHHMALTLELEPLLDLILDQLEAVVDYDDAIIFKMKEETLTALAHRGHVPQEELLQLRFSLENVLLRKVIFDQEIVIIPDAQGDTPLARNFRDVTGERFEGVYGRVRSWMGVPLRIKDRVIGILALQHSEPDHYTPGQADLVLAFADQAAVAIEHTRLYEQAQALAAMEERQRLAHDLHDAVSQTLFSASLAAEVLPRLWERKPDEGRRCLHELHRLTRSALAEMRTLLLELRPAALMEVELDDLLRQLVEAASSRARLPIALTVEGQCSLSPDVQVTLYRIAQEGLSNIVKHAGASRAAVSLRCAPAAASASGGEQTGKVELRIHDDGRGFDPERVPADCLGLCIMQERAEAIGAAIRIESQIGHGTQLEVVWPAA